MPETVIPQDWYSFLPFWLQLVIWYADYYILGGALYILTYIAVIIALILAGTLIGAPFFIIPALLRKLKGSGGSAGGADRKE